MERTYWKVGELARRTGLTVRALHHYDQIGLVAPSSSTEAGHRLYTREDIARLQQVLSLKQMGFSLEEIKTLMAREDYDPVEVLRLHTERLEASIRRQEELRGRLEEIRGLLARRENVTAEQFLRIIVGMNMDPKKYFSAEQLDMLKQRCELVEPDMTRQVEAEWMELLAKTRAKLESGVPPADPEVAALAVRWRGLMNLFSGGDRELVKAAERFHADNADNALQYGLDGQIYRYIAQAMAGQG